MTKGNAAGEDRRTRSIVLGTAGHIDHGKTSLIYALTGTDTDRLPEEKTRGITIELGFASLTLRDEQGERLDISFIDVPGHHSFIRNMLAGAGGVDAVLLIVAADEGVKVQTVEHLRICELLGVRSGLAVLTKKDRVGDARLAEVSREVADLVRGTFLAEAPQLTVSAVTSEGLDELKVAVAGLVKTVPERSKDFVARLPLDRVFTMRGIGTVVTGTLGLGTLSEGGELEVQPRGRAAKVRSLQVHGERRMQVSAPTRVAVNLSRAELSEVERGDVLIEPNTLQPIREFDADVVLMADETPLKHRAKVRLHAHTSTATATVLLHDIKQIEGGAKATVRLQLSTPTILTPGDRFVLRRLSPAATIGGGTVLDAAPMHPLRAPATLVFLEAVRGQAPHDQIASRVKRREAAGSTVDQLMRETGLTRESIRRYLEPLVKNGLLHAAGSSPHAELFISTEELAKVESNIAAMVTNAKTALSSAEISSKLSLDERVLNLALHTLHGKGLVQVSEGSVAAALQGFPTVRSDPALEQVETVIRKAGLASPPTNEIVATLQIEPKRLQEILTSLLRQKRLVRMGADNLLVHADALAELIAGLQQHAGARIDVAWFKNHTGLSRKYAIPLLEYLDGMRVTRNVNGVREVVSRPSQK